MVLDQKEKPKKENPQQFLKYALIPFTLSVPPIIGWALGSYLDGYFDTKPYLMYLCIVFGVGAACREFFRIIKNSGE